MLHSEAEEDLAAGKPSSRTHRIPPPWLFFLLMVPSGVLTGGITGTLLSFLLRRDGVPVDNIANEIALLGLPAMLYFLWSPITDFWLRRRTWYLLACLVSSLAVVAAFFLPSLSGPTAVLLLFIASCVMMMTSACIGGIVAALVPEPQKLKVSSMFQAGNLGGGALGVGGLIFLAPHVTRPLLGIIAAAIVVLPAIVALALDEPPVKPPAANSGLKQRLAVMWIEFKSTFLRWSAVPSLLVLLSPFGSGAAVQLLPGIAVDYGVSGNQVAWLNGMAGALLTASGALLFSLVPARIPARLSYAVLGVLNGLCLGVLCLGPPRPFTYLIGTVLYLLTVGACWAAFTAVVLQVIGVAGNSGGSRYSIAVSLGNAPVIYMTAIDGLGAKWWGTRGLPGIDMALSVTFGLAFLLWFLASTKSPHPAQLS